MPRLVLIAKNAYVWLDQLSKKYGRADHAARPDPRRGAGPAAAPGLHRPVADRRVGAQPRLAAHQADVGNPEAVASAYSLFDYAIADDLGGEAALREPAATAPGERGIRLASDMVPNHMGIDSQLGDRASRLVLSASTTARFPSTRSTGPICRGTSASASSSRTTTTTAPTRPSSSSASTEWTGSATLHLPRQRRHQHARGTTPRSSTTCKPEVREAVIQTILHVARQLPDHPLRRGDDAGQEALPAPLVPGAGHGRRHPVARRARPDARAVRRGHARRNSGARWWTAWPPKRPTRCCSPRRSG